MRQLRDYQVEAVSHLRDGFAAGLRRIPMVLATGLGKGHPLETDVPTPRGWRKWGDLEPGDEVFGRDGRTTRVLEVFDRGILPTYRVAFADGSSVEVDGDHLWAVRDSSDGRRWKVLETRALARLEMKRARGWRFHVPMTAPLERPHLEMLLDPYVTGALISNGCMTGSSGTQLTTPDLEVAARVARAVKCVKIKDTTPGVCDRYYLPGLETATRTLGMRVRSSEKRIPRRYLLASLEQRIALLHGLMDGDGGGRDRSRRSVGYFTSSEGLSRDISELVTSLGGTGIVKKYDRGSKGVEYAVRILLPSSVPPFSTSRKDDAGRDSVRNLQPKRAIVSITPLEPRAIRCIKVAARDSLYLITRQHIVTHNTEIFTDPSLLDDYLDAGKRVLIIAHTDELIMQAAQKARRNNPKRTVGIVKGQESNQLHAQIIVSSRQTLGHATGGPRRLAAMRNVGLIIIDEAHHAVRSNTYGKILEHFRAFCDLCPRDAVDADIFCPQHGLAGIAPHVAGFTATLARGDKAKLSTVWQPDAPKYTNLDTGEVRGGGVFRRDILFGIRHGYLLDVTGKRIVVPDLDMRNVRQTGGDYQDSALAEELERTYAPEVIAQAYADTCGQGGTYRKGIAFWPLVDTAYHGAKAFNDLGITSEVIHGQLPKSERRAMLQRLHTGETRVIHGVSVLTEGFDEPTVDVCVIARPTRSAPLYQQCVGRVLRPDLTKPPAERGKALVLDVVGAGAAHDLRSLIDLAPERKLNAEDIERRSLLELEDDLIGLEQARAGAAIEIQEDVYRGETEVLEFDPLGRAKLWARTPDGNWYMSAGSAGYAFLTPSVAGEPAHWDVVLCSKVSYPRDGVQPWIRATGLVDMPLELALGYAEDLAMEVGGTGSKSLAGRKSAWRKGAPSAAQEAFAKRLGVWRDGMTRGECSEAIDAHNAAVRIDPMVAAVRRAYEAQEVER